MKLMKPINVNNGTYKTGTVLAGTLGEGQRKVQSAVKRDFLAIFGCQSRCEVTSPNQVAESYSDS